jgi:hypothetical protein
MTRRAVAIGCLALLAACSGSSLPKTRFEVISAAMEPTIKSNASAVEPLEIACAPCSRPVR